MFAFPLTRGNANQNNIEGARGVAQAVEHLPSKHESLSSNSSSTKKKLQPTNQMNK
jgi:hypothetical protein